MAAYVELYVDQGASFSSVVNLSDEISNITVNAFGFIVTSQMRRSYYSANASANITCQVTNGGLGEITMSLSANQTSALKSGRYLFDMQIKDPSTNNIIRILEGIVTVNPRVTKS